MAISSATSGATIRYTTDGSTPTETNGSTYTGPVAVTSSTTLKAIAYETGLTDSQVSGGLYSITNSPAITLDVLYDFNSSNNGGINPYAALIRGSDGNFYGTASAGGSNGDGTIFTITPGGTFTPLVSFAGSNGAGPVGGLVQGRDGNFYGTTGSGGNAQQGVFFQLFSQLSQAVPALPRSGWAFVGIAVFIACGAVLRRKRTGVS